MNLPGAQPAAPQATLDGGSVYYWATYDAASGNWTLFGKGVTRRPASSGSLVRTTSSRMHVVPGQSTQQLGVWNQLFSNALPPASNVNACTTNITNGTSGVMESADLYVRGNLCMTGNPLIGGSVQVEKDASLQNSSRIGTSTAPVPRVSITGKTTLTGTSSIYATVVNHKTDGITKPPVDLPYWYTHADLGPGSPCTTGSIPGGFDSNGTLDWSRSTFILTPASTSYSCTKTNAQGQVVAKLIWTANGCNGTLQIQGTIFIDGPIDTSNCSIAVYSGRGTIYASSFYWHNGSTLCGITGCTDSWNTNTNMLVLVAGHGCTSNPCSSNDFVGFNLAGASIMQAAVYCVANANIQNGTQNWGPVIAEQLAYAGGSHQVQISSLPPGAPVVTQTSGATLQTVSNSYVGA